LFQDDGMKITRKPEWLQKRINPSAHAEMERMLGDLELHTVCQEASCPNISECFRQRQATFLILGRNCTRLCSFCNVARLQPLAPDPGEPFRVAEAVVRLGLSHVVITSPTRDDLPDGGAGHYAATMSAIREVAPRSKIELLVPDFKGDQDALRTVVQAAPDIVGHNLETVPRLYHIREGAEYYRSVAVLETLHRLAPKLPVKSGVMVGLGETDDELFTLFADLRRSGCTYLSIGQYLAPSRKHYPVQEFVAPGKFETYRTKSLALGFAHVESGPYVRSSYHAEEYGR
jgi:lipoic acid synthetase